MRRAFVLSEVEICVDEESESGVVALAGAGTVSV